MSLTPLQSKNNVVIAVAGSGKTTLLVRQALENRGKRILFLTYTNENLANIKRIFRAESGDIPSGVEVLGWFSFLLRDGVRPYFNQCSRGKRVVGVHLLPGNRSLEGQLKAVKESDTERYYFDHNRNAYTDTISQFVCKCNKITNGLVIKRLEQIYSAIYIDEIQDLAGWDLEVLKLLLNSKITTKFVGDPRQVTYKTNHANKNRQYREEKIVNFFTELQSKGMCNILTHDNCFRCNESICELANKIYPHLPKAIPQNSNQEIEDGIKFLSKHEVPSYIEQFKPVVLRHNKRANTLGYPAINFGASKGRTFDRVLIFPTESMKNFLITNEVSDIKDRAKFYVAVTRAKRSVAFVVN